MSSTSSSSSAANSLGEHSVTLLVAVLNGLYRFVVGHFTDNKWHFIQSRQFAAVGTAMARNNFIAVSVFLRAGKAGNHYTVYADRSNDFLHLRIVPYLKGVQSECIKRMNLGKLQINYLSRSLIAFCAVVIAVVTSSLLLIIASRILMRYWST